MSRGVRAFARLGGVLALLAVLAACGPAYRGAPLYGQLDVSDPQVALGQREFFAHCHQCHPGGDAGIGFGINDKPLPGWLIKLKVRNVLGTMPSFSREQIGDAELDAVVTFLAALRNHGREARAGGG